MAYDRNEFTSGADTFGFGGAPISLAGGDYSVPATVKGVIVVNAGNVVCTPVDGSNITITNAPVGFVLPWHCSTIKQTGTTATLATIIGR